MSAPLDGAASLADLLRFERLLADLSARFISLAPAEVGRVIDDALRRIVDALDVDRSGVLLFRPGDGGLTLLHSWTRPGFPRGVTGDASSRYPWAVGRVTRGEAVVIPSVDRLPAEASVDQASFRRAAVRSHVSMPMVVSGEVIGSLAFGAIRQERAWPEELIGRLRLVAEIFANALARKRAQEELDELLGFEQLLAEIAASLMTLPAAAVDGAIDESLRRVAALLALDRATLWVLAPDGATLRRTHLWTAADAPGPPDQVGVSMPWSGARMLAGAVVRAGRLDELPPEAATDKASLAGLGTRSVLIVPLRIAGHVIGALSLATMRAERAWRDAFVPRALLLGEVLAAALARQQAERQVHEAQTEAAQYRERLAHLVRVHTAGEMSAAIAHEINQPLVAIENYALAARRRLSGTAPADTEKLAELLDKIAAQSGRAGDVIKRLRAMVKRHEFETVPTDLGRVVTDALRFAELEGHLRSVRSELRVAAGLPVVLGDAIQLQQVVLNLARNAIDAMAGLPDGAAKVLTIEAGREGDHAVFVRVADRGPGFAAADAERIFEPFWSTKGSGLGIGLAICRTIVEAHGGRLSGAANPGGGATFTFTLPVADEPREVE
jgi:signal transduction histidine kinase